MSGNQSYMGGGAGSANMTPTPSSTASVYNAMGFNSPYAAWGGPMDAGISPAGMGYSGGGGYYGGGWRPPMGVGVNPAAAGDLGPTGMATTGGRPMETPDMGGPFLNPPTGGFTLPPGVPRGGARATATGDPRPTGGGYPPMGGAMTGWTSPIWGMASGAYGGGAMNPPWGGGTPRDASNIMNWIGSMYNPQNMLYNQGATDTATKSKGGTPFTGYPPPVGAVAGTTPPGTSPPAGPGAPGNLTGAIGMPTIGGPYSFAGTPGRAQPLGRDNPANDRRALALRQQLERESAERIRAGGY